MWGHVLHDSLWVLVVAGVLAAGFLIGRRWRREYRDALALRFRLEQAAKSSASATAQALGNRVDIRINDRAASGDFDGSGGLLVPRAVRNRDWVGVAPGEASLIDGDDGVLSEPVESYRPTALSRVLFGSQRALSRGVSSGERGEKGGE